MRTDLFDFELPRERIALRPVSPRDAARLLVIRAGLPFEDRHVRELPDLLRQGDRLVLNDSKVIPARLNGRLLKSAEPKIQATLHRRLDGSRWRAFLKPAKKVTRGDVIRFGEEGKVCFLGQLDATVEDKREGGEATLAFAFHGPVLDQAIEERGDMPLPPYIAARRAPDARDRIDYQTIFARDEGSVAAPTAALHFTDALLANLGARGIDVSFVTLHVGAGTFLPVKAEEIEQHKLQPESGSVSAAAAQALNETRHRGGRIIAVGTTALRLIETATDPRGRVQPFSGETSLFITPGFQFRAADALMTNFHLPRSTLFMLVAAFAGLEVMQRGYAHAIEAGYRFYSYGDACLLFRSG